MKLLFTNLLLLFAAFGCFAQSKSEIVRIENFKSEFVKPRNIEIWLPPGYHDSPDKKYPVLYMHDGQNVFNPKTAMNNTAWEADNTAERMVRSKLIEPVIIVAIWNTDQRYMEYFPEKAAQNFTQQDTDALSKTKKMAGVEGNEYLGDEYLKFLTKELKPYVDTKYRTLSDRANTAICGSSMGALISLYAICEYPDIFGQAACVSTHWPILLNDGNPGPSVAVKRYFLEHLPSPESHRIYFDYGTATLDQTYENHQKGVDNMMKKKGYQLGVNWVSRKFENADHSEKSWQERFHHIMQFLYKEKKKTK